MQRTQATFKLGIEFVDWLRNGSRYLHGFGIIGQDWEWLRCHQYWLRANQRGRAADFGDFSINTAAAQADKFMHAKPRWRNRRSATSPMRFTSMLRYMRNIFARLRRSMASGGPKAASWTSQPLRWRHCVGHSGGRRKIVEADFFIDCSGFRGLLIEQTLKTGYEDWSHWLPVRSGDGCSLRADRTAPPYTRSTAREPGWQWRIGLQHRTGNGLVYSSKHIDDDAAEKLLLANLDGEQLANPNRLRFTSGKRRKMWNRNCVALGLAAGFLEPLESTSIHLVQSAAIRLVRLFPDAATDQATDRRVQSPVRFRMGAHPRLHRASLLGEPAGRRLLGILPNDGAARTLQNKIDLWSSNGRIFRENDELFGEESWTQVFIGQEIMPQSYDPLVAVKSDPQIEQFLGNIAATIRRCVDVMPGHDEYIRKYCPADPVP